MCRRLSAAGLAIAMSLAFWATPSPAQIHGAEVSQSIEHDVSLPLANMPPLQPKGGQRIKSVLPLHPGQPASDQADPVVQRSAGPLVVTSPGLGFAGVGTGDYGFAPDAAPPDTNGA